MIYGSMLLPYFKFFRFDQEYAFKAMCLKKKISTDMFAIFMKGDTVRKAIVRNCCCIYI